MYKIHSYIAQDKIETKTLSHGNVDSYIQNMGKMNVLCIKKSIDFSPSTTTATQKKPHAIPQCVWALGKGIIAPLAQWPPGSAMHHLPSGSALFLLTGLYDLSQNCSGCTRPLFSKQVHKTLFCSLQKLHKSTLHTQIIFEGWRGVQKYGFLTWLQVGSETLQDHAPQLLKITENRMGFWK